MNESPSKGHWASREVPIMRSIGARLLRIVLSFYIIVAVSVTGALLIEEYIGSKRGVFRELRIYEKTFEAALANSLWAMDHYELQSIIQGMVKIPDILGVKVVDPATGRVFASAGLVIGPDNRVKLVNSDEAQKVYSKAGLFSEMFAHTFQVVYRHDTGEDLVGTATLYPVVA